MQMIDVLKRLAELDANNPNVVAEGMTECGPMSTMVSPSQPAMPASINVTAGSGEEVSGMLAQLMQLAGVHKVEPEHMGMEPPVATVTTEPAAIEPTATAGDEMRSVLDKMNGADDEETDEGIANRMFSNSPDEEKEDYGAFAAHGDLDKNPPDQGDRMDGNLPKGHATMAEQLMADYKEFVAESSEAPADEGAGIDKQALMRILNSFDNSMNEIGGYGDPDYNFVLDTLNQGDVESAADQVCDSYADQDGGELRHMDVYYKDLKDEFQWLVDNSKTANGVAEDDVKDFFAAGGKVTHVPPQRGPRRPGSTFSSKHIGTVGGTSKSKGALSGMGANTGKTAKPVVAVEAVTDILKLAGLK